jgi:hypothetical protein
MRREILLITTLVWVVLIIPQVVFGLRQTVGKIVIYVVPGATNSSYYGLINDANETLTVKLRSEGDAAEFISVPKELNLPPGKFVTVNVTISIPSEYNFSKGKNITGYVYALLEGAPGQVRINVQTRKTVEVIILSQNQNAPNKTASTPQLVSGLIVLVNNPVSIFVIVTVASFVFSGLLFNKIKSKRR